MNTPSLSQSSSSSIPRQLLVVLFWTQILFLPTLANLFSLESRYLLFMTWKLQFTWLLSVFAASVVIWLLISIMASVSPTWSSRFVVCFLALTIPRVIDRILAYSGFNWFKLLGPSINPLYRFGRHTPLVYAICLIVILALAAVSFRRGWNCRRWQQWLANTAVFMSPLIPILWFHSFALEPTFPAAPFPDPRMAAQVPVDAASQRPDGNVIIVVFDAWPYQLLMEDGKVRPEYVHLHEAAEHMCFCTHAQSPWIHTIRSLPRFLFQKVDVKFNMARVDGPNLFSRAAERGYRTYMIGWYHQYHVMLGETVDFVFSAPTRQWLGDGSLSRCGELYTAVLKEFVMGIPLAEKTPSVNRLFSVAENYRAIWGHLSDSECMYQALQDPQNGQFIVYHSRLPHLPFCYDKDGPKSVFAEYDHTDTAQAIEQLKFTDAHLGRILDEIRKQGKYDNSTIVLTADHNWRFNPDFRSDDIDKMMHVPLFIKLPGQTTQTRVKANISTVRLEAFLNALAAAGDDPNMAATLAKNGAFFADIPDRPQSFDNK